MSLADTESMTELCKYKINLENTGLCKGECFYGFKDIIICISMMKFNTGERNLFMYILLQVFFKETTLLSQSEGAQIQLVLQCNVILRVCPPYYQI